MQGSSIGRWLAAALAAGALLAQGAFAQEQRQAPQALASPSAPKLVPATKVPSLVTKAEPAPKGPAPIIACDQPEFDAGSVGEGEEIKHVYVIKNKGKAALKILSARGG